MIFRWVPVPIESLKQMRRCERVENETETAGAAKAIVQTNLGILRRCRIWTSTAVAPHLVFEPANGEETLEFYMDRQSIAAAAHSVTSCTRTRAGFASTLLRSGHANSQGTLCFLRRSLPAVPAICNPRELMSLSQLYLNPPPRPLPIALPAQSGTRNHLVLPCTYQDSSGIPACRTLRTSQQPSSSHAQHMMPP